MYYIAVVQTVSVKDSHVFTYILPLIQAEVTPSQKHFSLPKRISDLPCDLSLVSAGDGSHGSLAEASDNNGSNQVH
jgi:hypothetical protein